MILFARASTTRARCLEHASWSLAWTTSEFHGPHGEVLANRGIEQENVHDLVPVGGSI